MSADLTVPPPWPSADGNLLRPGKPVAAIYTGDKIRARDEEWQERIASLSARLEAADRVWGEVCEEAPAGIDSDGRKFILLSEERCIRVGSAIAGEAKK